MLNFTGSSVVRQRWVCSLIGLKITCLIREVSSAGFTRSVTQTWWSSDTNADNTWLWKKPLNDSRANFYCGVYFVMDRCDACLGLIVRFVVLCGFCEVCCYKNYKCTCFTLRSAGVKYFTGDQPVSSHLCVGWQKRRHLLVWLHFLTDCTCVDGGEWWARDEQMWSLSRRTDCKDDLRFHFSFFVPPSGGAKEHGANMWFERSVNMRTVCVYFSPPALL